MPSSHHIHFWPPDPLKSRMGFHMTLSRCWGWAQVYGACPSTLSRCWGWEPGCLWVACQLVS